MTKETDSTAQPGSVSIEHELDVMRTCVEALNGIDHDPQSMARVIRYLADRYGS